MINPKSVASLLALSAFSVPGWGAVTEKVYFSTIDWSRGVIVGAGHAGEILPRATTPTAEELDFLRYEAYRNCQRNLFLSLNELRVSPLKTFGQLTFGSLATRKALSHLIANLPPKSEGFDRDGLFEIKIELPFFGDKSLATLFYYHEIAGRVPLSLEIKEPKPDPAPLPHAVVFDLRGHRFAPTISPRIVDEAGGVLLTLSQLPLSYLHGAGFVQFIDQLSEVPFPLERYRLLLAVAGTHEGAFSIQLEQENADLVRGYLHHIAHNQFRQPLKWYVLMDNRMGSEQEKK